MRVLRPKETCEKVGGYSDQWLRKLEGRGQFPRRIRLGPNSVGHFEHEVDAWLEARAAERDAFATQPKIDDEEAKAKLRRALDEDAEATEAEAADEDQEDDGDEDAA